MVMHVIIPTRGRPHAIERLTKLADRTMHQIDTQIWYCVDDDDPALPIYQALSFPRENFNMVVGERKGVNGTLNEVANRLLSVAWPGDIFGFMGDDHRPRSFGWDRSIADAMQGKAPCVAYCNDLLQGRNLATAVFMTAGIVQKLGYMAPPKLKHLYMDNFWMMLGRETILIYLPEVIIEHMHPTAGKSEWDESYTLNNSKARYAEDEKEFNRYLQHDWPKERLKLHGNATVRKGNDPRVDHP